MNKPHALTPQDSAAGNAGQPLAIGQVLSLALRENRVLAAYQPIVDLKTGVVVAEEALARILSPNRSIIPASAFLDVARELALTPLLDRAIILQTFARSAGTPAQDPARAYFLNISTSLMRETNLLTELLRAGADANAPFVIQLSARELLHNPLETQQLISPILDSGMRLALDDFGSGAASYQHLASLPFSFLKIEGALIRRLSETRVSTIVRGIQQIAAGLGLVTLAEHIETEEIANRARTLGINWGQGKYFGKPVLPALIGF